MTRGGRDGILRSPVTAAKCSGRGIEVRYSGESGCVSWLVLEFKDQIGRVG
jgi:hypothetical protein